MEGSLFDDKGQEIQKSHISVTRHDEDEDPISENAFVIIADPAFNDVFQLECDLATGQSKEHVVVYNDNEVFDVAVMPPDVAEESMKQFVSPDEEDDRQNRRLPAQ